MQTTTDSAATDRLAAWFRDRALPLWAAAGHDAQGRRFHEQLEFDGRPRALKAHRLMVQCRQIGVYARASLTGLWSRPEIAVDAFEAMKSRYRSADGGDGWVFSLTPDGAVADATRDLYAHAFVVYACAWMHRLTGDDAVLADANDALAAIDRVFGVDNGYLAAVPGPTEQRLQNPHMHLFEAVLALADASGRQQHMDRCRVLAGLALDRMAADPPHLVREVYDADWRLPLPAGRNVVEPGHQMEWAWLLSEYQRLSGEPMAERIAPLLRHALDHGMSDDGRVYDTVFEDGRPDGTGSRTWPQTETLRYLARHGGAEHADRVETLTERLMDRHLKPELNGGWIDRLDDQDRPVIDYMPASTLYHVMGAVIDGGLAD